MFLLSQLNKMQVMPHLSVFKTRPRPLPNPFCVTFYQLLHKNA
jgi:hypothetical protein